MSLPKIIITSLLSATICFGFVGWIAAQTWTDPTSQPPNSTIPNISALAGDNLGLLGVNGSHQARYNLDMSGFPIDRIGSGGGINPALSVNATGVGGVGIFATSSSIGLYAESSASSAGALGAFNHGNGTTNGYGLVTYSDNGGEVSARLYGTTVLQDKSVAVPSRLQIGSVADNSLALTPAAADGAPLYYGSSLLCDPTKANCGFATSGSFVADNLGLTNPHTASKNLDLNHNRIINIVGSTVANTPLAHQTGSTAPAVLVSNSGGSHLGQPTALYGASQSTDNFVAGIYGRHTTTGAGIMAASTSGTAAEIHGALNTNDAVGNAYVSFGPIAGAGAVTNRLHAGSSANGFTSANGKLYWGNMILCDQTSTTCGWQSGAGGSDQWWLLSGQTVYYQASNITPPTPLSALRTNVGIGVANPDTNLLYQLQVTGLTRATGGYLGNLFITNLTVNDELSVGSNLSVGGNVTINGVNGISVDGEISVSASGITIGSTRLNKADLQQLITACGVACQ